jgi:predicted dienelactone hydrolase
MKIKISITFAICLFLAFGCGSSTEPPTSTPPVISPTEITITMVEPTITREPVLFPLSEPGPYDFGAKGAFSQVYSFVDTSRAERKIELIVWYPAKLPKDAPPSDYNPDAEPDPNGAPYPLILSSSKVGSMFGPHLASHGFVVVGVKGLDSSSNWGKWLINDPLDILFALEKVAATTLKGLEGMIDAEHAGVMGYSFDGYNSLAMSGARVDPEFYLAQCAEAGTMNPAPPEWWIKYNCDMNVSWEEFAALAGLAITVSNDGLWQPMTDERIRAVIPMAPEGAWLFGERGLAAVDRPTLIIGATADDVNFYDREAVYIFEHLGTPDKSMISFVGEGHMMIESDEPVLRMKHFVTAFFGYHLQGKKDYINYFSEDFVASHEGLAWGVYKGK